jgi:GrpB-like predicted nucleotidyltransferase (UPF0157 family)
VEMRANEPIVIVAYDPAWPMLFADLGEQLRRALGAVALRIDHIGSTAVPGLAAKPIIDIQIAVASLQPDEPFRQPLENLGFRYRADNPDLTKRYFRESPGARRTHIHVRRLGSWSEQFGLLFRDFLRTEPEVAARYAALKMQLAQRFQRPEERHDYVAAKEPFIWATMREADAWARRVGWEPGPTDA